MTAFIGRREFTALLGGAGIALVAVTHGANILPLTGVTPEEGGMVIVKPDPGSVAKLPTLGHIPPLPLGP